MKKIMSVIVLFLLATVCVAKPIDLYEQPKPGSKSIGKIDSAAGIMIIFSPKDNKAWTKVADPKNGNVGWVKSSELGHDGFSYSGSPLAMAQVVTECFNMAVVLI